VISDHVRAIAFSIADGQLPSNTGAGYVIRRILRRAVRYGYQTLQLDEPFLSPLSTVLIEIMGTAFPELSANQELIEKVIREEELSFFKTLEQGIRRIETIIQQQDSENIKTISGEQVFELYDTFGFPFDLTDLMAREANMEVDEKGFLNALEVQKTRSRAATSLETEDWVELFEDDKEEFIGYDQTEAEVKIVKYRKVVQKKKTMYQLVFNMTPFYPEGGGQVGDQGFIENDEQKVTIFDTKKENNLIIHFSTELPKHPKAVFKAVVNSKKRALSTANHNSTHLLHHALREILGDHVTQKGSLVNPTHLRFDFSHFSKVTAEEITAIEKRVNELIRENRTLVEKRNIAIKKAEEMGAMMLFGEMYLDTVRVIQYGDSIELCGGTHVGGTGNIGLFKITSESSVASGIRRIEAVSSKTAEIYIQQQLETLSSIQGLFKNPKNVVQSVEDTLSKNQHLQKQLDKMEKERAKNIKADLKERIQSINGINFLEGIVPLDGGAIKDILFQLKGEVDTFFAVIGGEKDGKCTLTVMIDEEVVKAKDLHAGNLVRSAAKHIQGGGGGQPFFATAGGKNPDGLQAAIEEVKGEL
jgi:alanyl-tRNA synthetase